jgi:hypothetical protein
MFRALPGHLRAAVRPVRLSAVRAGSGVTTIGLPSRMRMPTGAASAVVSAGPESKWNRAAQMSPLYCPVGATTFGRAYSTETSTVQTTLLAAAGRGDVKVMKEATGKGPSSPLTPIRCPSCSSAALMSARVLIFAPTGALTSIRALHCDAMRCNAYDQARA